MKKIKTYLSKLFGWDKFQIEDNKIKLTADEENRLKEVFGEKQSEKLVEKINQFLADEEEASATQAEMDQLRAQAAELISELGLEDANLSDDTTGEGAEEGEGTPSASIRDFLARQREFNSEVLSALRAPAPNTPVVSIDRNPRAVQHSATHLFSSNASWDAFEGRPWNQIAAGQQVAIPSFAAKTVEYERLNEDLRDYYAKNPTQLRNYQRELMGLPSFWFTEYNVDDRANDGNIVYGPITQARKLPWLPKGVAKIFVEENRVFPTSVDIEISGHELQKLMETWLNTFVNGTSGPYNMSFVNFLIQGWDRQARAEDRISLINGIHVPTPNDATLPGMFIHTRDGLLKRIYDRIHDGRIKVAHLPAPTAMNIVDHVEGFCNTLPQDVRNRPGLVLYMSPHWKRQYATRVRELSGMYMDYKKDETVTIDKFPNIKIETLEDIEGTDSMFITTDNNIGTMENVPGESGLYRMEQLKRNIYVFADYKLGIKVIHSGNKIADNDPNAFRVQLIWHNGQPLFRDDFFVHLYEVENGKLELPFERVTFRDTYAGDITSIKGAKPGQIIKIRGNKSVTGKVKQAAGIATDFDLSTGGTLTLLAKEEGVFTEISRTTEPETIVAAGVNFDDVIDADEASVFHFTGADAATLSEILNGNEGQQIKIVGGVKTLTVASNATIEVDSSVTLTGNTHYLKLVKVSGKWYEIEKQTE